MTHRSHIARALLIAASCLASAACSRERTTGGLLFIPHGTTSGGIGAKLDPPRTLAIRQSTSLGSIVDPGAGASNGSVVTSPPGTVTVITAPPARSTTAAATSSAGDATSPVVVGTVNGNYGAYTGRNVVASAGVVTH